VCSGRHDYAERLRAGQQQIAGAGSPSGPSDGQQTLLRRKTVDSGHVIASFQRGLLPDHSPPSRSVFRHVTAVESGSSRRAPPAAGLAPAPLGARYPKRPVGHVRAQCPCPGPATPSASRGSRHAAPGLPRTARRVPLRRAAPSAAAVAALNRNRLPPGHSPSVCRLSTNPWTHPGTSARTRRARKKPRGVRRSPAGSRSLRRRHQPREGEHVGGLSPAERAVFQTTAERGGRRRTMGATPRSAAVCKTAQRGAVNVPRRSRTARG
jgi:hypothetical protein